MDLPAPTNCPCCGFACYGTAYVKDRTADETVEPQPGSVIVCGGCAAPLVYLEGGGLRRMTFEEERSLPNEQRVRLDEVQAAVKKISGGKPR